MRHARSSRGFSLLEVLVAAAVLCVLVLLLNQIIGSTMDVVGQGRRFFEIHSKARAAMDLLARDLSQGLYRSDITPFQDGFDNPALVFFTRRGGTTPMGSDSRDFRQLSLVAYQAKDDAAAGFALWRGAINVQWDAIGTYPAVNALTDPMPFAKDSVAEGYRVATDAGGVFEPILKGVIRMELRFLADDGKYYLRYNNSDQDKAQSKAAVITLLFLDERTESVIRGNPALLGTFRQNFMTDSYLQTPEDSNVSLSALWDEKLNQPAIWGAIPQRFRNGITTVERVVPLR